MKKHALRMAASLFGLGLTGILACSGGGGCGGEPPPTTSTISCGKGTHQEGKKCVANTAENTPGLKAKEKTTEPEKP